MAAKVKSILIYQAAAWPLLTVAQNNKCATSISNLRRVTANFHDRGECSPHRTKDDVTALLNATPPNVLIAAQRLSYLPRLLAHGPDALLALPEVAADSQDSWWTLMVGDLQLLRRS